MGKGGLYIDFVIITHSLCSRDIASRVCLSHDSKFSDVQMFYINDICNLCTLFVIYFITLIHFYIYYNVNAIQPTSC